MDNRDYENLYGEIVGFCNRHKITIVESCDLCEEEAENDRLEEAE
jgi:hypothetical protein